MVQAAQQRGDVLFIAELHRLQPAIGDFRYPGSRAAAPVRKTAAAPSFL